MPTLRVDGNDVLAVYAATAEARRIAIAEGTPVLLEAMTYRIGAHSTSDDDTKYRTPESPEPGWDSERAYRGGAPPIIRFGRYLATKGLWSADQEDQERRAARKHAIKAPPTTPSASASSSCTRSSPTCGTRCPRSPRSAPSSDPT